MFKCDCCGLCCCNLDKSSIYQDLDRGDGICKYFDENTRLCKVYENRPLKCRVDEMYEFFFMEEMPLEEFYELNYEACEKLKKEGSWNVFRDVKL